MGLRFHQKFKVSVKSVSVFSLNLKAPAEVLGSVP